MVLFGFLADKFKMHKTVSTNWNCIFWRKVFWKKVFKNNEKFNFRSTDKSHSNQEICLCPKMLLLFSFWQNVLLKWDRSQNTAFKKTSKHFLFSEILYYFEMTNNVCILCKGIDCKMVGGGASVQFLLWLNYKKCIN